MAPAAVGSAANPPAPAGHPPRVGLAAVTMPGRAVVGMLGLWWGHWGCGGDTGAAGTLGLWWGCWGCGGDAGAVVGTLGLRWGHWGCGGDAGARPLVPAGTRAT